MKPLTLLAVLWLFVAGPASAAETLSKEFGDLSMKVPKGRNGKGPNIVWLASKKKDVRIGELRLKVPKSEMRNCSGAEGSYRYRFNGTIKLDTTALGDGYPSSIQVPLQGRTADGKLRTGRKISISLKLQIHELPSKKVVFERFYLKAEPAKCD